MASSRSFVVGLAWRVAILVAAVVGLDMAVRREGVVALRVVAAMAVLVAIRAIWAYVGRANDEVARFIEAIRFGDLSQGFRHAGRSGGFSDLGEALDGAMRRLRDERVRLAEEGRYHATLVEEAPLALLSVGADGQVGLVSKEARRMFGARDGVDVSRFADCGAEFVTELQRGGAGRRLVNLIQGGLSQRVMLSVVQLSRPGAGSRLFAVSPIQRALSEAELAAQSDLVRVLTHEIMNSLTPVTSLARSAVSLMSVIDGGGDTTIGDARRAVETVARRADALMGFVESYRQFARLPEPRLIRFDAQVWAAELARLFSAAAYAKGVTMEVDVRATDLVITGDPGLLSQAAINLLKNAAEAAAAYSDAPIIRLSISKRASGYVVIAVDDNGGGLPAHVVNDIFLPFFTTKEAGSGVGLSVARQIALAHEGTITADPSDLGGACFRIML